MEATLTADIHAKRDSRLRCNGLAVGVGWIFALHDWEIATAGWVSIRPLRAKTAYSTTSPLAMT